MKRFYTAAMIAALMCPGMALADGFEELMKAPVQRVEEGETEPTEGETEEPKATVIWTVPGTDEGMTMVMPYEVGCKGATTVGLSTVNFDVTDGMKSEMVINASTYKYYIKNPLPRTLIGSYIEGDITSGEQGTGIKCQLPQWLNANEETNMGVRLSVAKAYDQPDGSKWYLPVETAEENVITYWFNMDTYAYELRLPEGYALVSLYSYLDEDLASNVFSGAAIFSADYKTPTGKELTTVPSGVPVELYGAHYGNGEMAHLVDAAVDFDTIYLTGVFPEFPEAVILADLDADNNVIIKANQYLGETPNTYNSLVFTKTQYADHGDAGWVWEFGDELLEEIVGTYDPDTKALMFPEDVAWFSNAGTSELYYSEFLAGPYFKLNPIKAATPENPEITNYIAYNPSFGWGQITFTLPLTSTDGEVLVKDNYTYIIYIDNEPYTFNPEDYSKVPEAMEQVPYAYDDDVNFGVVGLAHTVRFVVDADNVGIQALYTVDGETLSSEVISVKPVVSVENVEAQAVGVEFYNLNGQRVLNPAQGVFIKKILFENGRTMTQKVVKY